MLGTIFSDATAAEGAQPPSVAAAKQEVRVLQGASPAPCEETGAEDTSRRWQQLASTAADKRALEMLFGDLDVA